MADQQDNRDAAAAPPGSSVQRIGGIAVHFVDGIDDGDPPSALAGRHPQRKRADGGPRPPGSPLRILPLGSSGRRSRVMRSLWPAAATRRNTWVYRAPSAGRPASVAEQADVARSLGQENVARKAVRPGWPCRPRADRSAARHGAAARTRLPASSVVPLPACPRSSAESRGCGQGPRFAAQIRKLPKRSTTACRICSATLVDVAARVGSAYTGPAPARAMSMKAVAQSAGERRCPWTRSGPRRHTSPRVARLWRALLRRPIVQDQRQVRKKVCQRPDLLQRFSISSHGQGRGRNPDRPWSSPRNGRRPPSRFARVPARSS